MEIRQTVANGMPIINGIWYLEQQTVIKHRIWDTPSGRRLTPLMQTEQPRFGQRYLFCNYGQIPVPETGYVFCFGRLRDPDCGQMYLAEPERERVIWAASYAYAAPFVKGKCCGRSVMLAAEDGELWQVSLRDPHRAEITIMKQTNLIQHIK